MLQLAHGAFFTPHKPVFAVSVQAGLMEMLSRMGNRPIQSVQGSGSTTARMIANATI